VKDGSNELPDSDSDSDDEIKFKERKRPSFFKSSIRKYSYELDASILRD